MVTEAEKVSWSHHRVVNGFSIALSEIKKNINNVKTDFLSQHLDSWFCINLNLLYGIFLLFDVQFQNYCDIVMQ